MRSYKTAFSTHLEPKSPFHLDRVSLCNLGCPGTPIYSDWLPASTANLLPQLETHLMWQSCDVNHDDSFRTPILFLSSPLSVCSLSQLKVGQHGKFRRLTSSLQLCSMSLEVMRLVALSRSVTGVTWEAKNNFLLTVLFFQNLPLLSPRTMFSRLSPC